jgi:hypothetical protein
VTSAQRVDEVARTLLLCEAAAQAIASLTDDGIGVLVLKGPSIMSWLYAADEFRPFRDIDLLVDPTAFETAVAKLKSLGYTEVPPPPPSGESTARAVVLARGAVYLDVHRRLIGVEVSDEVAWDVLAATPSTVPLRTTSIPVLAPAARATHLALHAAQRGVRDPKAIEDLRRGLNLLPADLWRDAAALATALSAGAAFTAGLQLLPAGQRLAHELGLRSTGSVETLLRASAAPDSVLFLERLRAEARWGRRIKLTWEVLFPPAAWLATGHDDAGGRINALRRRLGRVGSVVGRAAPSLVEWRRRRGAALRSAEKSSAVSSRPHEEGPQC